MARRKWHQTDAAWWTLTIIAIVVILAGAIAIRYAMAGGNVQCVFSADPALCATVGQVTK